MIERDTSPKLQRERSTGKIVGVTAFASVVVSVAALGFATRGTGNGLAEPGTAVDASASDDMRRLVDFNESGDNQLLALALRSVGVLLCIAVGLFIYWLARRRETPVPPALKWTAIAGPVLVVLASVFGYGALKSVADTFVGSGAQTAARASDLYSSDTALKFAFFLDIGARAVFGAWVIIGSLALMRVGLLTSFLGYWGVAAGAIQVFPVGIGDAMFIGWLASMGFLTLGWWPGGRPEAWDTEATQVGPAS